MTRKKSRAKTDGNAVYQVESHWANGRANVHRHVHAVDQQRNPDETLELH